MVMDLERQQKRIKDISLILRDFLKVIKVVALYPESNPLPHSLKRSFSEKLVSIIETYGDTHISVGRETLSLDDDPVFTDSSKEESLAGLFFETGITSFTFKENLDVEEIYKLLDIIKEYNNSNRRIDLVSLIWEASLEHFSITTVEDIALAGYEGDFRVSEFFNSDERSSSRGIQIGSDTSENYNAIFSGLHAPQGDPDESPSDDILADTNQIKQRRRQRSDSPRSNDSSRIFTNDLADDEKETFHIPEAIKAMGFSDLQEKVKPEISQTPNTALILNDEFKLTEQDEQQISQILSDDALFDTYESTIELLKEMLHQESVMSDFYETVGICEKVSDEMIQSGHLNEAGHILDYFKTLEDNLRKDKPLWAEKLKDAFITAGSKHKLVILSNSLNQNQTIGSADLKRYLDHFGWEALNGLVDLLGELEHESHRRTLCDFLSTRGKDYIQLLSKGLFDKRWFVVRNSVMILSHINDEKAISYLEKVIQHEDRRVRVEVISGLKNSPGPKALQILIKAVFDTDAEIRQEAITSILSHSNNDAFEALTQIINHEAFLTIEKNDQKRILIAYSSIGGEHAVEYLKTLINRKNIWRDPSVTFFRDIAFDALANNQSEKAEKALLKFASSWLPDVKQHATNAIRKRREILFGADHETNG